MVHAAYQEWKAAQDKAAAKKAMQAKLQRGLADMFKAKLSSAAGGGLVMGALKPTVEKADLDSSKLNLLQNQDYSSHQADQWNSSRGEDSNKLMILLIKC